MPPDANNCAWLSFIITRLLFSGVIDGEVIIEPSLFLTIIEDITEVLSAFTTM